MGREAGGGLSSEVMNVLAVLHLVIPVCGFTNRDRAIPCPALATKCSWGAPYSKVCRCDEHGLESSGWKDAIWAERLRYVLAQVSRIKNRDEARR